MLAYVFWHWPDDGVEASSYVASLRRFHRALNERASPDGLVGSSVARLDSLPWEGEPRGIFEDWYLVDDWKALGVLNGAAVSGACEASHGEVASLAGGGSGGVYALVAGEPRLGEAAQAAWFSKPAGLSYNGLLADVAELPHRAILWQRQMVLGPAPEFCLMGPAKGAPAYTAQRHVARDVRGAWASTGGGWSTDRARNKG